MMHHRIVRTVVAAMGSFAVVIVFGCAAGGTGFEFLGSPFNNLAGGGTIGGNVGNTGVGGGGGAGGGSSRDFVDPCTETQSRKFIRISMRNQSEDFIHYFLFLVAFVATDTGEGSVCQDDIGLYESFGYNLIPEGSEQSFGNFCIEGPALTYFHRNGQFSAGGTGGALASAISPAQGTTPTFDTFFNSAGAMVPVPDQIIFHNPGTGEGAQLKISRNATAPCDVLIVAGDPECLQDSFYYVDDIDLIVGSDALGIGSGRRVPGEVQGTGCSCLGTNVPAQLLAPSGETASGARCNEFLRGGTIQYVFIREDTNPPIPQLLWRVTDSTGVVSHEFDPRANIQ